ncbi:MAG: phage portal protein [Cyanobacteria bacterium J06607_13]
METPLFVYPTNLRWVAAIAATLSKVKIGDLVSDQIRNDGVLINTLTGMGTDRDVTQYTAVGGAQQLAQASLDQLCQVWPLSVAVTAFPNAATSKGWALSWPEGTDDQVRKDFDKYRAVIGTRTKDSDLRDQPLASDKEILRWAGFLSNIYRGAAIVLNIDDGRPPHEPIDTGNIRTIREIEVLDSFQIYPSPTAVSNPLKAEHYHLQVTPGWHPGLKGMFDGQPRSEGGGYYGYPIHRSRVIRVPGVPVPPQVMRYNNGWDRSLLEVVWDRYSAWESVNTGVENLIKDYSLFVYKLSGFSDLILEENEDAIRARVKSLQIMASVMGGVMLDKDEEEVSFVNRSFTGLNDLSASFRDMLIGALGIPHTILFGESPSGLGATGEAEEKTWAKKVGDYQGGWPLAALTRLYQLIFLAKDGPTSGKPLDGWEIAFNPLLEQTEAEKIANRAAQAQIDTTYKDAEILVKEEIRKSRFGGTEYSFETMLDDEVYAKAQQQAAAAQGGEGGGEQSVSPEMPPAELAPEEMSLEELQGDRRDSARPDSGRFGDKDLYAQAETEAREKFKIWPTTYSSQWLQRRYKELYKAKNGDLKGAFGNE